MTCDHWPLARLFTFEARHGLTSSNTLDCYYGSSHRGVAPTLDRHWISAYKQSHSIYAVILKAHVRASMATAQPQCQGECTAARAPDAIQEPGSCKSSSPLNPTAEPTIIGQVSS